MKTFLDLHSPDFGAGLSCARVANANKETLDLTESPAINHQVKGSVLGGLWQHSRHRVPWSREAG